MAENAKDYLHSEELSEWDTVFDPGGKQEYTEEQLIRFAEIWSKKQLTAELGELVNHPFSTVPLKLAIRLEELEN
tara:strand:+ start:477 stop:701 length:225 start_codon:yes stop_codon:yes gene_type:complete